MKRYWGFGVVLVALSFATQAFAQSSIVDQVVESCGTEIDAYCSDVTPGNGRILACFYAHEDKLSVQCINALYDGIAALERYVATLSYVVGQCQQDIDTTCGQTVPGEARIASCLLDNKANLTASCSSAIDEVGLSVE